jgi:poly-gamma-glutamate synthesis protein (capsule biosynthesis protein)
MIQSRRQSRRKKKRSSRLVLLGAALAAGAVITACAALWPGAGEKAAPDSREAPPAADRSKSEPGKREAGNPEQAARPQESDKSGTAKPNEGNTEQAARPQDADKSGTAKPNEGGPQAVNAPDNQAPAVGAPETKVKLAFVGDILLADTVEKLLLQNGYDYPYTNVKTLLSEPDLTVANLETPVTERGEKQTKEYVYRSSPQALPALRDSGIDVVNLANNHVMDYGAEGLLDTVSNLDAAGIPHVGAGSNLDEALKPVIVEKNGIRIAVLGFSRVVPNSGWKANANQPGVADTYSYTVPVETIRNTKQQADLVVVFAHWGTERKDTPDPVQTDLAHRYIDAGADLVIASHPHVLQGLESYKDKWIAYSLGNFIFTTNDVAKTWETIVLQAECAKTGACSLKAVPVLTKWASPEPLEGEAGAKLLQRLSGLSYGARIEADGSVVPTTTKK